MTTGINTDKLNLRSGPDTSARILRVIEKGSALTILDTQPSWLKVQIPDGSIGYVAAQYVAIQAAPPVPAAPASGPRLLIVPVPLLNVRSSPTVSSTRDNRIGTLPQGTILTPLESDDSVAGKIGTTDTQGQWIKIKMPDGREGYVAAWLVNYAPTPGTTIVIPSTPSTATSMGSALQPDLHKYIDTIPDYTIPGGYQAFWAQRAKLGLPDPFDISPTKLSADKIGQMTVNGFGPNSFALANWQSYYRNVCGMHNGLDHIVSKGTQLVALSDGIIVGNQTSWPFIGNANDKDIILWCFLPEQFKDTEGNRLLSNVLLAYAHMSDNSLVTRHEVVNAGDVIGVSGNPAGETGNEHLHLEVHLLSGDNSLPKPGTRKLLSAYNRPQPFDNRTPFNPLLFFSERLVKYHLHQGKKMGFNRGPTYPDPSRLAQLGINWPALDFFTLGCFQYGASPIWNFNKTPWPNGIYDLDSLNKRIANYVAFDPYPADFI